MRDAIVLPLRIFVESVQVNKPMDKLFQLLKASLFTLSFFNLANPSLAEDFKLGLPIECKINTDCFIQNLPDTIQGEGLADSFCQGATYDGHKGLDIRVMSLKDIERNVPIIASARGTIKALRDGEDDRLILSIKDRKLAKNKECGNGVVISHEDGFETQYCHLRKGSLAIKKGEEVDKGDVLGFLGNSGFSAFPHIHLTVRKDGQWLDPITGQIPSKTCTISNLENSLFENDITQYFKQNNSRLMTSGITGGVINHSDLVKKGAPKKLTENDKAIVGWAWFINLRKGDEIRFTLEGPQGLIVENTTDAIDRHKADFSAFTGKRIQPQKGEYKLTTELLRNGKSIEESLYVEILE